MTHIDIYNAQGLIGRKKAKLLDEFDEPIHSVFSPSSEIDKAFAQLPDIGYLTDDDLGDLQDYPLYQ